MTAGVHFDGGWKFLIEVNEDVFAFDVRKGGLFSNILAPSRATCGAYILLNNVTGAAYVGSSGNVYQRARQHRSKLEKFQHPNKYLNQGYYPAYKHHFDVIFFFTANRAAAYNLEQWLVDELIARDRLCNIHQDVKRSKKERVVPAFHKPESQQSHYLQLSQPDCLLGVQGGFHDPLD
jgi:predicted GIY-YIG superfamily endonuclease